MASLEARQWSTGVGTDGLQHHVLEFVQSSATTADQQWPGRTIEHAILTLQSLEYLTILVAHAFRPVVDQHVVHQDTQLVGLHRTSHAHGFPNAPHDLS